MSCLHFLRVLSFVIASGEDVTSKYRAYLEYQTLCCGADCHPGCKSKSDLSCPLDNWKVDHMFEMAGELRGG